MNRIFAILFLIVTLVGAGLILLLARARDRMSARLVQHELEKKRLEGEVRALKAERDRLRTQVSNQASMVRGPTTLDAPEGTRRESKTAPPTAGLLPAPANFRQMLAGMLKNPAMKELMNQQQLSTLDAQYGGLFARFQLDEMEKADFKQLLAERLLADAEWGLQMMNNDLTPEEAAALKKEHEEAKKASDARIREFLNNDADFAIFQDWEDTKAERMQLDMGRAIFANSGEPLSLEQEQQLIHAMRQVRNRPAAAPPLGVPENFDPARLTQADIDRQLARQDADAEAVARAAATFLTSKQLESLRTLQQQWRTMTQAGLMMSQTMFQTEAGAPAK